MDQQDYGKTFGLTERLSLCHPPQAERLSRRLRTDGSAGTARPTLWNLKLQAGGTNAPSDPTYMFAMNDTIHAGD